MAANTAPASDAPVVVDRENPTHSMAQLTGWQGHAVFYIAIAFTFFQIVTAAFSPLPSQVLRSVHVGFLLLLTFVLFRFSRGRPSDRAPWYDWLLGLTGFLLAFYHWV